MADTAAPALGYGNRGSASIDSVNQWMRSQPWYQEQLAKWGQDPNNVHLTDPEKQDIVKLAQANGVVVDEGHNGQEIDNSGNFQAKSHTLRNAMIVAGIAGAALLTAGAAGAFGGAALAGGEGAGAAAGAGEAAGLAGVEGGAAGLGDAGLAALGTGAMGTVPVAAGTAAGISAVGGPMASLAGDTGAVSDVGAGALAPAEDAAAGSVLPSTTTAAGSAALPEGVASGTDAAAAGNTGILDTIGSTVEGDGLPAATDGGSSVLGKLGSTLGKFAPAAGSIGQAIGAANTAAGQNRLNQENLGLTANAQNITGNSAFEQELMNRAKEEDVQRTKAAKDVYRASYNANPRVSPFDPAGAPKYSPQYLSVSQALADQGQNTLSKGAQYATSAMPALAPYKPINPADVQGATNTQPGTASKIADYVGPALSTAQLIAKLWPGS